MTLWNSIFSRIALVTCLAIGSARAEVGSGRSREPDVSDPRAIGHRGVLDQPTDSGSSARSNWHAVEAARDRGADRIVDDQTWALDRLDEDRQARRETEMLLEDRDRTLRVDAREAREQRDRREERSRIDARLRSEPMQTMTPLEGLIIGDEQEMDQARKDIGRKLSDLRSAEARDLIDAHKKFSSPGEAPKLKAETDRIHAKFKAQRDKAMDDYVGETDRLMGLPKMIEGPLPPERPTTRPAHPALPARRAE